MYQKNIILSQSELQPHQQATTYRHNVCKDTKLNNVNQIRKHIICTYTSNSAPKKNAKTTPRFYKNKEIMWRKQGERLAKTRRVFDKSKESVWRKQGICLVKARGKSGESKV